MSAPAVGISKRDILIFLFKWKRTLLGWSLFTVFMVTLLTYLVPQVFPATTNVVVERNRSPTLRSTYTPDGLESIEAMNNEIAIVRSRAVMSAVVDELKPHERPSSDGFVKRLIDGTRNLLANAGLINSLGPQEKWIDMLLRNVEVELIPNSNILKITYADEDAQWSARIVNSVTKHYISQHLEVFSSQGVTDFYSKQLAEAEQRLAHLREEVKKYKQRASVSAIADRQGQLVRELTAARTNLSEAERRRDELLTRFTSGHTEVVLEGRAIGALREEIATIQQSLDELEEQQGIVEGMDLRLRNQEAAVLDLQRSYDQAHLSTASNADIVNVRLIEYAEVPRKPRYTRLLLIMLSLPLGVALATCIALLREYLDHRIENPEAAEAALGVPCLGSVPQLRGSALDPSASR